MHALGHLTFCLKNGLPREVFHLLIPGFAEVFTFVAIFAWLFGCALFLQFFFILLHSLGFHVYAWIFFSF
jgi:hypothetical protein